jgi:Tfp pilus assembly protein PilO
MLIAVTPLFGFWKYYVTAVKSDLQVRQGRLSELRSSTAQAAATTGQIEHLRKDVARLERDVERFENAIPTRKDVAAFLETVDALAARSNLTVRRFAPQPAKEQSSYAEVSYKLQVDGKYQDLATLFERMSYSAPTLKVRDLTISSKLEPAEEGRLRAECLLATFVSLDANAAVSQDVSASDSPPGDGRRAGASARDPFEAPAKPITSGATNVRPSGLQGLYLEDIAVKGIIRDAGGFHALLQATDKRTFIAHAGDKLLDAVVKTVTGDAIVFARTEEGQRTSGEGDVVRKLRPVDGGRR